jgi:hypothetical protein
MSDESRQRIIRRAGSQPAEAELQEGARESREAATREDAERQGTKPGEEKGPTPLAEDRGGPPRPRR